MLKYFTILFAFLTLVVAGCSFSDPEPEEIQEQLDMEHAQKIQDQERQQEEEMEQLFAQESVSLEESEVVQPDAVDNVASLDKSENLLQPASIEVIQPEVQQEEPEKVKEPIEPISKPNIVNTISKGLKSILIPPGDDNVSSSGKLSPTKFVPESPLAIFSALKLVPCKVVPEKMESIHKRLLKIKDVNIADSKLRDKTNDSLMPVVHFDFDQITVKPAYIKLLRQQSECVMKTLKSRGDMIVQIEGHADERGSDEYNMALGHRRANVVANVIKVYIPDSSLAKIFSFGEEFPSVRHSSKNAWAKNRRVEFTLLLKP